MPELIPADPGPKTLSEALSALQAQLPRVAKEHTANVTSQRTGRSHSYDYADLTDVSTAILPLLARLGLSFTCCPTVLDSGQFVLDYSLRHVSEPSNSISGLYPLPSGGSPQEIGSAITYARRYALCAVTGLAPGGDDDDARSAQQRADGLPVNRDGSLSRSQTSDDEKAVAGVMTKAQQREHSDLRRHDRGRPADRSNDPADDMWAGQPAGDWQPVTPEDKPGSSNAKQHQQLGILYSQLGITERDTRLVEMTDRVGRQITSAKDLSYAEAAAAIKELRGLAAKMSKEASK